MKLPPLPKFIQSRKGPLMIVGGLLAAGAIAFPVMGQFGFLKGNNASNKVLDELTVTAKREKLTAKIKSSGTVTPRQTVNVSPKTSGKVVEMLVEQGDTVTEGQVIARMDDSDLQQDRQREEANVLTAKARLEQFRSPARPEAVNQARNEVERSEGDVFNADRDIASAESEITRIDGLIGDAESQLALATRQYDRNKILKEEGGLSENALDEFLRKKQAAEQTRRQAIAQREQSVAKLQQSYAKREQAKIQVDNRKEGERQQNQAGSRGDIEVGEAQLKAAIAQLNAVEQKIKDTEVRSPFAGLVTQRYASVGAFVTPTTQASSTTGGGATSTSLVAIASEVEILAKIPEVDIGQVKVGLQGDMAVDAFPGETFKAKVRLIAPEAIEERDVRFFQVRLKLINGQRKLKSGMNADIEFSGPESEALLVPTVAIVTKKGRPGVLVPDEKGNPKFQPVTAGTTQSVRPSRRGRSGGGEGGGASGGAGGGASGGAGGGASGGAGKSGGKTQITEGLKEGDRVFIKLPDGKKLDELLKDEKDKEKK